MNAILSSAYCGTIQYYSKFLLHPEVVIEQYDSFLKQSYRSRCQILGANGLLDLAIPVVKVSGQKTLMKDVRIANTTAWQQQHWKSIVSAYNSSPFFEYYVDDFEPLFKDTPEFLIDFNMKLHETICELIGIDENWALSCDYEFTIDGKDYRDAISPKPRLHQPDPTFIAKPYTQTFEQSGGFVENLSILDLLFNVGPESIDYLEL